MTLIWTMLSFRLLALAILPLLPSVLRADDFIIDDAAIKSAFSEKLGKMVDAGKSLPGKEVSGMLNKRAGSKIAEPVGGEPCTVAEGKPVYANCKPAVVAIGSVYKCGKCAHWHLGSFATGWIFSPDGLIVTNFHVLDKNDANTMGVMTADGEVFAIKEVLAGDKAGDAAIFRIDTGGKSLPFLRLADGVAPGEDVQIISHPKGRFYFLSRGVVSRFQRQKGRNNGNAVWMSVTADYAVGSSGGPVFNPKGEVVGMVSSTSPALTDEGKGKATHGENVQMVFKDCVSLDTLRGMIRKAP